jgi:hypothetical protein
MIYKFKSKAAGDVIMMGPNGDQLLRLMGREPSPKGIIELAALPAALAALERAVAEEEARASQAAEPAAGGVPPEARDGGVSLRQRVWSFVELLRRSQAAGEAVVWGV